MRFSQIDDEHFDIYINNLYLTFDIEKDDELYDSLRKILINIRKKYAYDIYGFYEVNIYVVENLCTILRFAKKEENIICKTIDLKIIKNNNKSVFLEFDDYFIIKDFDNKKFFDNKFYININNLEKNKIATIIEHANIVIDEKLNYISTI